MVAFKWDLMIFYKFVPFMEVFTNFLFLFVWLSCYLKKNSSSVCKAIEKWNISETSYTNNGPARPSKLSNMNLLST